MMRSKKQKGSSTLSVEDVTNLTIFKNAIKEISLLRTYDLKKKMMSLKQSPIFTLNNKSKVVQSNMLSTIRSKAFD
jgi:hypothetical protein